MILISSGKGFLLPIVLIVTFVVSFSVIPKGNVDYIFMITTFITGAFGWYFGRKWNLKKGRILIDQETGDKIQTKERHSLFWIPIQYIGFIILLLGVLIAFNKSTNDGLIYSFLALAVIIMPFIKIMPVIEAE